ncbi:hypothetical protein ACFDAU_06325 [Sulfuriferula sp. GW1]|uniref:hypothetical protein n=1 Tax=Sulfuriferula sp. GW1 TaxID=3345111 RepID=UPI0039B0ECB6
MTTMFIKRDPLKHEEDILCAYLSTFREGSGSEREQDGTTRAGWRQIERVFAELLGGIGGENKGIFDVVAVDDSAPNTYSGFSVKSKQLSPKQFSALPNGGRVYMEIANSPAKFWEALKPLGLNEDKFREGISPEKFGTCVIEIVEKWHKEGKEAFETTSPGKSLDLNKSCYLCLSYSKESPATNRKYQVHAFDLIYAKNLKWKFKSEKCLTGCDPVSKESVIDWYALSGGQLKYYPKATDAKFKSSVFTLSAPPKKLSIHERAIAYFPHLFE